MNPGMIIISIQIILQLITVVAVCFVKFNDLRHLGNDMKHVKKNQENLLQRVSKIEGKLENK